MVCRIPRIHPLMMISLFEISMKYHEAFDNLHFCKNCEQDVKIELHLMGHDSPHYAKAACPICAQYIGWVGKPENNDKRTKSSRFTPANCNISYCEICGRTQFGSKEILEAHHKIPIQEGGLDERDNILFVCTACHKMCHFLRLYLSKHLTHYYEAYDESD